MSFFVNLEDYLESNDEVQRRSEEHLNRNSHGSDTRHRGAIRQRVKGRAIAEAVLVAGNHGSHLHEPERLLRPKSKARASLILCFLLFGLDPITEESLSVTAR